jgi:hypothetical protein
MCESSSLGGDRCEYVPLNSCTLGVLSDTTARTASFTPTATSLSVYISIETLTESQEIAGTIAVNRNLRNLTVGNAR